MNQRRYTRVPFLRRAQIETKGETQEVQCLDLSLRGVLLVLPEDANWSLEQHVRFILTLGDREQIVMECFVAHIDDDVVGCACDSLSLESMITLRRILELNATDPGQVQRELAELIREDKYYA